jgi:hypothetical protein
MRRIVLFPIVLSLVLAACTKVGQASSQGQIQTEVARQLTVLATPGASSQAAPAKTQANPAATDQQLPTVTPTDTPTVTPTATATPTQTPSADDPAVALGGATWRDDFHAPDAIYAWEDSKYRFAYDSGMFVITGLQNKGGDNWSFASDLLENFYLEMTSTIPACSGYDRYGLVIGDPTPNKQPTFVYRVACNGQYSFGFYDPTVDNNFHFLINWTANPFILAGSNQTNRIGLKAQGTRIMLYVNGHFLAETDAPGFVKGRFGVFAASPNTAGMEVRITSLAYWRLP